MDEGFRHTDKWDLEDEGLARSDGRGSNLALQIDPWILAIYVYRGRIGPCEEVVR